MRVKKSFEFAYQAILGMVDFAGIYGGYVFAYLIYDHLYKKSPQNWSELRWLALVPAIIGVFTLMVSTVYRCQPGPMELDRLRRILSGYFWSQIFTFSLTFFAKSSGYSRLMVLFAFVFGILNILIGRAIFARLMKSLRSNIGLRRVLIIGGGKVGKTLARNLINSPGEAEIIGFLDDQYPEMKSVEIRSGEKVFTFSILGKLSDLHTVASGKNINEVIVAITQAHHTFHQDLLEKSKDLGIHYSIVPSALDLMLTGAEAYSIGHIPLFRIGERSSFVLSPVMKRALDIAGASLIGILSAPIWIFAAIGIRLDSPGPALFVHERVGKKGGKFLLYKFRSMHTSTSPYSVTPENQEDPRITKLGKFLRRTSIDEIPQILNVLKGDMSLVGPRPEMPFIVDKYDEFQKLRLMVKPGLTGVWQISADRANPIHENLDYDFYYLKNQSIWLDLAILVKTFTSVARGVGAY